jgi:hypothetical protein
MPLDAPIDWPIGHCWLGRDEIDDPSGDHLPSLPQSHSAMKARR